MDMVAISEMFIDITLILDGIGPQNFLEFHYSFCVLHRFVLHPR